MPYTNNWEPEGLYRTFTGDVNGVEVLDSNFELHLHPNFKDIKYIINDFTEVTRHSIEATHTKIYAETDDMISSTIGVLKIAIIVIQSDLIDLANNYRELMRASKFDSEVFKTIEDAREWVSK